MIHLWEQASNQNIGFLCWGAGIGLTGKDPKRILQGDRNVHILIRRVVT